MGVAERRAREKEALKSKILDAASELFVAEGVDSVSLRKIADRIEYSPATIYLYFRDKLHLLTSLCESTFLQLKEKLEEIEASDAPPVAALRQGLESYIEFGCAHRSHYLLTFGSPPPGREEIINVPEYEQTNQVGLETFDCLRRALRRCKDSGELTFNDLEATAQAVWMHIHGITMLLITSHEDPDFPWVSRDQLIRTSLDITINGLRPRTS